MTTEHPNEFSEPEISRIEALGYLEESLRIVDEAACMLQDGKPVDGEDIWAIKTAQRKAIAALEKAVIA